MTSPVSPGARAYAEDVNAVGDASARRVVARMVATAVQSIPHNTATAVAFAGEDYDTHGGHDPVTNNSRFTVPAGYDGYYDVRGTVMHGSRADYSIADAWIRKNGATNIAPTGRRGPMQGTTTVTSSAQVQAVATACRVFLVAGDYVELVALHSNIAAVAQNTNQSSQFSSVLEVALDRL